VLTLLIIIHVAISLSKTTTESEDEVRVARSQKDRAWDGMREAITKIKNARKNADWPMVQDEFANVNKLIEKSKMLIIQSGFPKFYIKMLMELEEHVAVAAKDKEAIKKMKSIVARALNQLKLQVRKHNEQYRAQIDECKADPSKFDEAVAEEAAAKEKKSGDKKKKAKKVSFVETQCIRVVAK
jgi:translation initiation factor 3 subunit C